jgi:hypothetical protein
MMRKVLFIVVLIVISMVFVEGCKKRSGESESGGEVSKTVAEYETEAEREINEDNVEAELKKIEEAVELEASEEP